MGKWQNINEFQLLGLEKSEFAGVPVEEARQQHIQNVSERLRSHLQKLVGGRFELTVGRSNPQTWCGTITSIGVRPMPAGGIFVSITGENQVDARRESFCISTNDVRAGFIGLGDDYTLSDTGGPVRDDRYRNLLLSRHRNQTDAHSRSSDRTS